MAVRSRGTIAGVCCGFVPRPGEVANPGGVWRARSVRSAGRAGCRQGGALTGRAMVCCCSRVSPDGVEGGGFLCGRRLGQVVAAPAVANGGVCGCPACTRAKFSTGAAFGDFPYTGRRLLAVRQCWLYTRKAGEWCGFPGFSVHWKEAVRPSCDAGMYTRKTPERCGFPGFGVHW